MQSIAGPRVQKSTVIGLQTVASKPMAETIFLSQRLWSQHVQIPMDRSNGSDQLIVVNAWVLRCHVSNCQNLR